MRKKGDIEFDTLIPYIIAAAVIALSLWLFFTLKGSGVSLIDYFKNLWRFRG